MNEIYDPEPQTLALGAGLVMLFILAVYRRGRYDSTASNIIEVPAEEEMKLEEEIQMDIPEPVVEQDDDIELLDELDSI